MTGLKHDQDLIEGLVAFTGMSPTAIAREAGVAATTIIRPHKGSARSRLSMTTLDKLRERFPDYKGWAAFKIEPADTGRMNFVQDAVIDLPEINVAYGLGASYIDDPIETRRTTFSLNWLRQLTDSAPESLFIAKGVGDSMLPTIHPGDFVLVDRSQTTIGMADQLWAIAYGEVGAIKRLRPMPDGGVKIMSDSQSVLPETAYDGEMHLIGRVVAITRKI